jgi:uncharacterized damage-inducible protein DinB
MPDATTGCFSPTAFYQETPSLNGSPPLVQVNIDYLNQAAQLVEGLSDAVFRNNALPPFNSGVGKHLRHILDFYAAFLTRSEGRIDYDRRLRDARVEAERPAAVASIQSVCAGLASIKDLDETVWSSNDETAGAPMGSRYRQSTIGRELQFLASHTVHHFAMIAFLLHAQGVAVPKAFGVAPSTLTHWIQTGSGPPG